MQRKKNDVKSRTTLLLSLPDEHQLRFSKYKTAKELWAAILKTFGGNKATKKRKKNLLKQQYGNFKAEGSETLEQTFNRLQVIVSQLQFMDVEVEKDDLNQKFLTSLAHEWLMHTIVWRNMNDLDTMSLDDLDEDGNTAYVPTASTTVPTASASVAILSQDTASAYIASQSSGSQIKFEDINQIDEDDIEEMDIKWSMALLSMRADKFWKKTGKKISIQGSDVAGFDKSKVECFNCHKMGHFTRECRVPKSQERGRKDNYRQGSKAEEKTPKALMAIDGVGWDWSYMANEGEDHALVADAKAPTEFALMANTESKVFDNYLCSNDCKKNNDSLNSKIKDLTNELFKANNYIYHYKLAVAQLEGRLVEYKEREVKYIEKIRTLELYRESNLKCIKTLSKQLETLKLEKKGVDGKLAGLLKASKNLDNLIESQRSDKVKDGVGYNVVPPPAADLYLSSKKDLSWIGLPEFVDDTVTDYSRPMPTIESTSEEGQNKNSSTPEDVASPITPKLFVKFVKPKDTQSEKNKRETPKKSQERGQRETTRSQNHAYMRPPHRSAGHRPHGAPMRPLHRSAGHRPHSAPMRPSHRPAGHKPHDHSMNPIRPNLNGNISYLYDFEPFDGGYVSFGQGGCKITGKGTIKIVNKSQNKTPYELFNGRTPAIGFLKPFGYHVMILNTLDNLGKFKAKGDEEFFENMAIEKGAGPNWLFDIDSLTKSMNYVPVDADTNSTNFSGTKDAANQEVKKDVSSLRYIAIPNLVHDALLESSSSKPQGESSTKVPEGSGNPNPTASTSNPLADQIETLTVESPITTVSLQVPTACLNDSSEPSSEARLISKRVANQEETPSLDNIISLTNRFEDILGVESSSDEAIGVEADVSNIETSITAIPTPTLRFYKDHPKSQIIGPVDTPIQTRHKSKVVKEQSFIATIHQKTNPALLQFCLFSCFLSQVEPKKNVWTLVDCPKGVRPVGTKWVLKNKKDKKGIVIKNKARLVAQGHTQEEGIDYDIVFAPVARIEAIRLFLAYASFMIFTVYQMDVKGAFLYGTIDEEVGTIDQTLFIKRKREDFILVQVYVDDIIFGSSNPQLCREFEALMHENFQMSAMGELNFFLGLQVLQKEDGIFLSQDKLISWQCKKQTIVATSTTKAEYVAAASCCGQVTWIQNQLLDYGYNFMNTNIYIDNNSAICIVKNPVYHSKTKHIEIRHYFIRDCFEMKLISMDHIHTDENIVDLLTKPFDLGRFQYLVCKLFPLLGKLSTASVFLGFGLTFAGTSKYWGVLRMLMISFRLIPLGEYNTDFHPMVDFIAASPLRYALTVKPTIFVSHIRQFWSTARIETTEEGTRILATVDGIQRTVSESSLRRNLKLQDEDGIVSLLDTEMFENLTLMGPKSTGFNEFSSNIATALVCLATNRIYNFSKMIFDGMVKNVNNKISKVLMYPRFLTICLRMRQFSQITHTHQYVVPFHTKKLFTTLRVNSPSFSGRIVPLFDTMLVHQGEGSGTPNEPHHTPSPEADPSYHTTLSMPLPSIPTAPISPVTQTETTPIRQYTRRARIAQSSALPTIVDEPASLMRDVTPRVTSPIAAEGSMQPNITELTALCTSLQRQYSELLAKFQAQEVEIRKLKDRVTVLEDREGVAATQSGDDAPIKRRSIDEGEAATERISDDSKELARVLTSIDAATVFVGGIDVPTGSGFIPTVGPPVGDIPIGSDDVPTASLVFATATVVTPYSRRKGKEVMVESDTPKKQRFQEQIDAQVARELEEQQEREDKRMTEEIARDAKVARIHAGEELQGMIDSLDRTNETIAKYNQEYQEFASELPLERRIELISDLVKYQDNYAKTYKSNLGWKVKDFKGMTFEEIEAKFNMIWKQVEDFIHMGSKEEAERYKRKGKRFDQESSKKLKSSEEVIKDVKSTEEIPKEKMKEMMQLVPIKEVYVQSLQVKHPIIDWKALVKECLSIRPATSEKEMELWVELKRFYEPDPEDQLWTLTQNFMHAPVEWKLYDLCGVH
nr:hypothetical protein [Tanacetum cinerariifolium]